MGLLLLLLLRTHHWLAHTQVTPALCPPHPHLCVCLGLQSSSAFVRAGSEEQTLLTRHQCGTQLGNTREVFWPRPNFSRVQGSVCLHTSSPNSILGILELQELLQEAEGKVNVRTAVTVTEVNV